MVRIRPKWFPTGTVSAGVFKILKKLNYNAYVINLPEDFKISFTFNVENLVDYEGPDYLLVNKPSPESFYESLALHSLPNIILIQQRKLIRF